MSGAADRAREIAARFVADGAVSGVEKLPGGNINDTWLARSPGGDFILQRINHEVFREPALVVHNMRVITVELARRCNGGDPDLSRWRFPEVIASIEGPDVCRDGEGNWWRAITYLDGTFSVDRPSGPGQAAEAGRALGVFHRLIANLPPTDLHDTLPGFHVTPRYVAEFDRASRSPGGRERLADNAGARSAASWVESRRHRSAVLEDAARAGLLMPRPIHGDPKIANLLFDQATGRCVSVIDFDTVKPGLLHYDIGDCVRSCCNPAGEAPAAADEAGLDPQLARALLGGYLAEASPSPAELALIPDAVWLLTYELAVRFLADHLDGDRYFRVPAPGHNLHRALVQIALCKSIEAQQSDLANMVR